MTEKQERYFRYLASNGAKMNPKIKDLERNVKRLKKEKSVDRRMFLISLFLSVWLTAWLFYHLGNVT